MRVLLVFPYFRIVKEYSSPLRYPGGKARISGFLEDLIELNDLQGCTFYELYAGGAGAALNLLFAEKCAKVVLNDLDKHIYHFWKSILEETTAFIRLMETTPINVENWRRQQEIYCKIDQQSPLEVGFSTFFLNRCNRSGILFKAGPIGGFDQTGNYKIDCRFNREDLIKRIEKIANNRDRIRLISEETISALPELSKKETGKSLFFLDPPYYAQGENLYLNHYQKADHEMLANALKAMKDTFWFLTYDNHKEINALYKDLHRAELPMSYTLQTKMKAKEVMIFSPNLEIPKSLRQGPKVTDLKMIIDGPHAA